MKYITIDDTSMVTKQIQSWRFQKAYLSDHWESVPAKLEVWLKGDPDSFEFCGREAERGLERLKDAFA